MYPSFFIYNKSLSAFSDSVVELTVGECQNITGINDGTSGLLFRKPFEFEFKGVNSQLSSFTLSFWFKLGAIPIQPQQIYPNLYFVPEHNHFCIIGDNLNITTKHIQISDICTSWQHIVITADNSDGITRDFSFYLNGKLLPTSHPNIFNLDIGLNLSKHQDSIAGLLFQSNQVDMCYDELAIFSTCIRESDIAILYQNKPVPLRLDCLSSYVDFLLDGGEFYGRFLEYMIRVYTNNPYQNVAESDFDLQKGQKISLVDAINKVSGKHIKVNILLWEPNLLQARFNPMSKRILKSVRCLEEQFSDNGFVTIKTDKRLSPLWGNHIKIAIFQVGGVKAALIGGFNLGKDYQDTDKHLARWVTDSTDEAKNWHDTSVMLRGAVVDDIEAFFDELFGQPTGNGVFQGR